MPKGDVAAARVLVVGAGASNLKSAVALNLAAALAAAGTPARLCDLDGTSSRTLRPLAPPGIPAAVGAWTVRLPWAAADLAVACGPGALEPAADGATTVDVLDPPPRFDVAVRALAAAASLVLVPADASALARRVLGEVTQVVAPGRLRVVLARRLPRAADRWALVDALDALAPDALSPVTVPMARAGGPVLYAPGTSAARAYARLAADVTLLPGLARASATHAARWARQKPGLQ